MIKNENIICISSIDWDFIWQGHQEIMTTLANNGNKVLFIENTGVRAPGVRDISRIKQRIKNWLKGLGGIRQESENLYIYSPLVLPFPYSRIARWINCRLVLPVLNKWMKIMNFHNAIVWTFLPTPLSLDIIDNISKKILVYYCIDNFIASSNYAKKIKKSEKNLLGNANLVFVTSNQLYNHCSQYNNRVYKFPFAVNFHKFEKARLEKDYSLIDLKGMPRPIVGYIGGIHRWIDQKLVKTVAEKFPEYSFVFAGPLQTKISFLSHLKNIYFLGKRNHDALPFLIKNFDVCIIPYIISDYTKNVYPTKLNEYHAMGKPIVSTDLPEVADFNEENDNLVLVAKNYEDFVNCISEALSSNNVESVNRRIASARKNSWQERIEQMSNLIEDVFEKKLNGPVNWQESLLGFIRVTQKRILKTVVITLAIYILLFYTPLVWFMANPLKISEKPVNADCIVVFAGGVGESGLPGQGYEERVQYAVELYKKGYARNIIFSSGYTYVFKEPLLMRTLAVSLGVPIEIIILEDKAKNTYENIKFSKETLDTNNWKEILLISSPYHMRRAAMVMKKNAPQIQVTYTPIPISRFYTRPFNQKGRPVLRRISLKQIKAILHEYLGIIYYWWKGYI